ncbi:MAG: sugar ABC transporter ATP-binding protein [Alicyclobacillus sp.]|nr:sugar ABC transporter ATP-binding protein [Alicyclobacillus sp.]
MSLTQVGTDKEGNCVAARCISVTKYFGGTPALRDVSVTIRKGCVHAFVGANGAGKSTCLGMFAGRHHPTSGLVEVLGRQLLGRGPREARRAGVAMVYQELSVVPGLTAVENAFLGQEVAKGLVGRVNMREMVNRFKQVCEMIGVEIAPYELMRNLSVASAQMVEIIRAVVGEAALLLFDEPTTSLSDKERNSFFRVMETLKARGVTQVLVSHNLEEVLAHADYITVFRDGQVVDERPSSQWSKQELISAMAGEMQVRSASGFTNAPRSVSPPVLIVEQLRVKPDACPISFHVQPGEIVGLAGLMGSGRSSILRAIAGANPAATGRIAVNGRWARWPQSVRKARELSIGYLPEDRKTQGLLLRAAARESILLGGYKSVAKWGFLSRLRMQSSAEEAAIRCHFDPVRLHDTVDTLSGGNQQKLMLARWVQSAPAVLLCDEPTRGVDVVARTEIWDSLHKLCDTGMAVVVVSSEFEELFENCHRILVVAQGEIIADLSSYSDFNDEYILQLIFDHDQRSLMK